MNRTSSYLYVIVVFAATVVRGQEQPHTAPRASSVASAAVRVDSLHALQDSTAAVLRGETEDERMFWLRRRAFVESVLEQSAYDLTDSSFFFRFALSAGRLGLDHEELAKISPQRDLIGERLRGAQSGAAGMLNVGNLLGQGVKYLASKLGVTSGVGSPWTIMPSETEVRVMKILWREGEAASADIYAELDSTRLNYKEVNTVLENMVGRGLVERRQISPRNEFTILGTFAIEMSSLNAKNREYIYRPRAGRDLMLAYLDATAYTQQTARTPAAQMLQAHLRKLLSIIAQESSEF